MSPNNNKNFINIIENIRTAEAIRVDMDRTKFAVRDLSHMSLFSGILEKRKNEYQTQIDTYNKEMERMDDELKTIVNKWLLFDRETLYLWIDLHRKTCNSIIQKAVTRRKINVRADSALVILEFWNNFEQRFTDFIHSTAYIVDYNSEIRSTINRWIETLPENRPDCAG